MRTEAGFTFTGIGTSWCVLVDGAGLEKDAQEEILEYVRIFNARFSRFLPDSEACAFREGGTYDVSEEFALLLSRADALRRLTGGLYDPAVGGLLEQAGYDAAYGMTPSPDVGEFVLPKWRLNGQTLTVDGPAVFDIGGMGKGYCIDRIAEILESYDYAHYLVDGGGDMFGTSKRGGAPWQIAIEYPGKADTAAAVVQLADQGLAVSDTFRRRWGKWHHIVHPYLRAPVAETIGVAAVANNAWDADSATSALFFCDAKKRASVARVLGARYLLFRADHKAEVSADWEGELFV